MSEKETTLLFIYGTLQYQQTPIGTFVSKDKLKGVMYDLGRFPCLTEVGVAGGDLVEGTVVEVPTELMEALDIYESVSSGLYARKEATTEGGLSVITYEYTGGSEMIEGAERATKWPAAAARAYYEMEVTNANSSPNHSPSYE